MAASTTPRAAERPVRGVGAWVVEGLLSYALCSALRSLLTHQQQHHTEAAAAPRAAASSRGLQAFVCNDPLHHTKSIYNPLTVHHASGPREAEGHVGANHRGTHSHSPHLHQQRNSHGGPAPTHLRQPRQFTGFWTSVVTQDVTQPQQQRVSTDAQHDTRSLPTTSTSPLPRWFRPPPPPTATAHTTAVEVNRSEATERNNTAHVSAARPNTRLSTRTTRVDERRQEIPPPTTLEYTSDGVAVEATTQSASTMSTSGEERSMTEYSGTLSLLTMTTTDVGVSMNLARFRAQQLRLIISD
ncbi:unnamed protein product [Bodo saltans]|uniref:Uncharacterized protein n=1 Tax=Bodo saltans TaxID=75058 RepID=A0A0S4J3G4_BODSA|nr:unnamed protein product [Bodo saltans]|eukprot:CUG74348.1 unnamed protein product [Bodo saltans]